jgi:glycine/D-amino acid oxidase-like deaminating enzyme
MTNTTPSLPSRADVAIVGGGIAGCATAYYLSTRGLSVVLVDKGAVGYEQSTRNWGWVHQQVRYPHLIPLAMRSVEMWMGLEDALSTSVEWRQGGNLSLAYDDVDIAEFEGIASDARAAGLDARLISRDEVQQYAPGVGGAFTGALHVASDGQANPHLVTAAFARAAREAGATIIEDCAATELNVAGGRAVGVTTEGGEVQADTVLVAGGAWTARLLRGVGLRLPQRSVRSTVVRTKPLPQVSAVTAWGDHFTFRQDLEGRFVLAGGASSIYDVDLDALRDIRQFAPLAWRNRKWVQVRAGRRLVNDLKSLVPKSGERNEFWQRRRAIDPKPVAKTAKHTLGRFRAAFPGLPAPELESTWAGYIDSTPDQAPVIGPAAGVAGLHVLTGLSGHGFALGPAAAEAQADLITGAEPRVDMRTFRFTRFADKDLPPVRAYRR